MHHFDDEVETLNVIRRTLAPGGRIFIHEGVRPAPGSEGERQLIAEMEEYGTLESPFDPEYLVAVLVEAGFTQVERFAAVDVLLDVSQARRELRLVEAQLAHPPMNTVIAVNPPPTGVSVDGKRFHARIEASGSWESTPDGQELLLPITVTNDGRSFWPTSPGDHFPPGVVTIWPYLPPDGGDKVALSRLALSRSVASGESIEAEVRIPRASVAGRREIGIDLVREGIAWFVDYGSPPLIVPLPAED
jgi:hypothetical protein